MTNKDYYELLNEGMYALKYGSIEDKKNILLEIKNACNNSDHEYALNQMRTCYDLQGTTHIDNLFPHEVNQNLQAFCETLWQKIQKEQPNIKFPSYRAINYLALNNLHFTTDVIYQKNGYDLNVEKLLDLVGYGLKFVSIAFNANTDKLGNYNTALKCLNRILYNDKPQNPLKDLSYILEVLFAIQNHFEQNEQEKKNNKIISLSVSLFIEFLTKTSE